jgi:hypothetical protein
MMKELIVRHCVECPLVIDGSKYAFPECSQSEVDPETGLRMGVSASLEAPIPDWCPLRDDVVVVKLS